MPYKEKSQNNPSLKESTWVLFTVSRVRKLTLSLRASCLWKSSRGGSVESLVFIMSLSVVEKKCIARKTCEIKLIFANISTVCHEM